MLKSPRDTETVLEQDPNIFPGTGLSLVVRWLADRVNWLAVVDDGLPWDRDRARIAPSVILLMLVINVLTQRNPLYQVEAWVQTLPLALLWGDTIQASQFNDDALGRVLEDLADHGPALLATLGTRMQAVEQAGGTFLHSDTSAFALFGDYPAASTGPTAPVLLTYGHSKDHRPDLKQIMMGITMDSDGQVLAGTMLDGNTPDKKWHPAWLEQLEKDVPATFWQDHCYISDAAVVTDGALTQIAAMGMTWLGRLPANFTLAKTLKEEAWAEGADWEDLGPLSPKPKAAQYRAQTFDVTLYDQTARAWVYHSSALDKRKERTLQREIDREAKALARELKTLARMTFDCEADAATMVAAVLRRVQPQWHAVTPVITAITTPVRRRGRPKKEAVPATMVRYRAAWTVTPPSDGAVQQERERRSTFVLVSSQLTLNARTALQEYKHQDHNEHGFRWTKDPIHLDAFFVQKPARVAGVGYLLLLALQFVRFMRAMVREALKDKPPLAFPHRTVKNPSDEVILDALRPLWIIREDDETGVWYRWGAVPAPVRRILDALGVPVTRKFVWDPSG